MLPAFPVEGGLPLALVRGAADAAVLSAFGAPLALAWLAPPVLAGLGRDAAAVARRLRRLAGVSLAAAVVLTAGWLLLQSVALGGSAADAPAVLGGTLFGHLVLVRLGLLGLAGLALARRRHWAATLLAGAAVATQAGHGHAWAMWDGPSWLLLSSGVHLVAAGAWLGGLLPLLVLVAAVPPGAAALASARFSPLGTGCVALLAGTALFQSSVLVGTLPGLVGTGYGLVALAKLAGFLGLLGFAARNRFRLTPALAGGAAGTAKRRLVLSVALESGVGLAVVLAAGVMTSLEPSMHEQPLWPFPWRPSLDAVQEDDGLLREAVLAGGAVLGAVLAAAAGFLWRWRIRWAVAAAGVAAGWLAAPHLDVLVAGAYPTQYWRSPTGFASAAIVEGAALYPAHCARCHGAAGHGDGPAAGSLPVPPADLTAGHLWGHPDGELFWWLAHGIEAPGGGLAMPGFAGVLTEGQRWALLDWVRANNAGVAWAASGMWPVPVQAPGLEASCAGGGDAALEDLRGQAVRIVFGPARAALGVVTIQVTPDPQARPGDGLCVARQRRGGASLCHRDGCAGRGACRHASAGGRRGLAARGAGARCGAGMGRPGGAGCRGAGGGGASAGRCGSGPCRNADVTAGGARTATWLRHTVGQCWRVGAEWRQGRVVAQR